jgi:FAD/FMN-containing dehydrogenase
LVGRLETPTRSVFQFGLMIRFWFYRVVWGKPSRKGRGPASFSVVAAVNFTRENELLVAVRGGRHNVSGKALRDDGIVIDLSGMKGIHVDARNHTARVQGGATLGDVDRETHVFGLVVPAGVISKTGIAGLTLRGGVGWLVRKYGLSCDNVQSFDVVTADGKPRLASADENEDLFWALSRTFAFFCGLKIF